MIWPGKWHQTQRVPLTPILSPFPPLFLAPAEWVFGPSPCRAIVGHIVPSHSTKVPHWVTHQRRHGWWRTFFFAKLLSPEPSLGWWVLPLLHLPTSLLRGVDTGCHQLGSRRSHQTCDKDLEALLLKGLALLQYCTVEFCFRVLLNHCSISQPFHSADQYGPQSFKCSWFGHLIPHLHQCHRCRYCSLLLGLLLPKAFHLLMELHQRGRCCITGHLSWHYCHLQHYEKTFTISNAKHKRITSNWLSVMLHNVKVNQSISQQ